MPSVTFAEELVTTIPPSLSTTEKDVVDDNQQHNNTASSSSKCVIYAGTERINIRCTLPSFSKKKKRVANETLATQTSVRKIPMVALMARDLVINYIFRVDAVRCILQRTFLAKCLLTVLKK